MPTSPVGPGCTQGRVDQGVDWSGSCGVFAVGSGTIISTTNAGWPGGTFIALKLDNPPDALHTVVYYAEDIAAQVAVGQHVNEGQQIGQATGGGSGIEIGWAAAQAVGASLSSLVEGAYKGSGATQQGNDFLNFIGGATGIQTGLLNPFSIPGEITKSFQDIGKVFSVIFNAAFWKRLGIGLAGTAVLIGGLALFINSTKAGKKIEGQTTEAVVGLAALA